MAYILFYFSDDWNLNHLLPHHHTNTVSIIPGRKNTHNCRGVSTCMDRSCNNIIICCMHRNISSTSFLCVFTILDDQHLQSFALLIHALSNTILCVLFDEYIDTSYYHHFKGYQLPNYRKKCVQSLPSSVFNSFQHYSDTTNSTSNHQT
jgi:hypothetical protein